MPNCENNLINPDWAQHGYIQVYTGNGKGKTTASLGLAMRALGRCWKVLIIMFTKGGNDYGELNSFRELSPAISDNLTIVQAGLDRIIYNHIQANGDSLTPIECQLFRSGVGVSCIRFTMPSPLRIIEFYGYTTEIGQKHRHAYVESISKECALELNVSSLHK